MSIARKKPLRLAFVGWGAIARRVADLLTARNDNIVLAGIATRSAPAHDRELPEGARWLPSPDALRDLTPDLVVEAAGRAAVEPWGLASLRCAPGFVVSSTSAFTDDAVLQRLVDQAERFGSRILIPSGALGGLDALAAASRLPLESVTHRIIKPPRAWKGTPAEDLVDLGALTSAHVFFRGSAREAASRFPANANVAAISALAGIGFERTGVELVANPATTKNCHHLVAKGDFGTLVVMVENRPLGTNPKSSEMTALSLVHLIEGRVRPVSL
ncbi:aspartate dehydrogenase [Bradyrhizobium prioriisuperbiae]|uniref:aspartate dehydrogenase n=1 Tax=Bradyrhizobium prioriisuperbiae TaxID=2854389 RepID=UPI0028E30AE9|nr:aspartate dehydrogenase [Bradyrhizobium prioritasuperba]